MGKDGIQQLYLMELGEGVRVDIYLFCYRKFGKSVTLGILKYNVIKLPSPRPK